VCNNDDDEELQRAMGCHMGAMLSQAKQQPTGTQRGSEAARQQLAQRAGRGRQAGAAYF
jgi:hypothetical protein